MKNKMPRTKKKVEPDILQDEGIPIETRKFPTPIENTELLQDLSEVSVGDEDNKPNLINILKMRKDIDLLIRIHADEIRYASLRDTVSLKGTSLEEGVATWMEKMNEL